MHPSWALLGLILLILGVVFIFMNARRKKSAPQTIPRAPNPPVRPSAPEQVVDFFVSHASADAAVAKKIVAQLETMGVRCWMAPRDIAGGTPYAEAITHAVSHSTRAMLLLLSADADRSQSVLAEVELARRFNKRIVPLFLTDIEPSKGMLFYISTAHWIRYDQGGQQALQAVAAARA